MRQQMRNEYEKQVELEWRFQRARDRFNSYNRHFKKLLPQLTGFTSPQMVASVERFFVLRIKGPLCKSRAEMLECFFELQKIKQRRQIAMSQSIAEQVTPKHKGNWSTEADEDADATHGTLFAPGAPKSTDAHALSTADENLWDDDDKAAVPESDSFLYGFEEDEDGVLEECDAAQQVAKCRTESIVATESDCAVEAPSCRVPLRRRTLEKTFENLQRAKQSADGNSDHCDSDSAAQIVMDPVNSHAHRSDVGENPVEASESFTNSERPDGGIAARLRQQEQEVERPGEPAQTPLRTETPCSAQTTEGMTSTTDRNQINQSPLQLQAAETASQVREDAPAESPLAALELLFSLMAGRQM